MITPDFGRVNASTKMLGKQKYRAVVKDSEGRSRQCFALCYVFRLFNHANRFFYYPSNFQVQSHNTAISVEFMELPHFDPDRDWETLS